MGRNYVKAMPRYCYGSGLLDAENRLTPFGRLVVEHDPALQKPETQWVMHYFLSLADGPGPAYWHDLVARYLRVGSTVSADQVAEWVSGSVTESGDRELAERTVKDSARIFLKTYSRDDGLNQLGLVEEVRQKKTLYEVKMPSVASSSVIGAALVDLWARRWPGHATANLSDVTGVLGEVFFLGQAQLSDALRELQRQEVVELWRVAPPFQVAKTSSDDSQVWGQLYGK